MLLRRPCYADEAMPADVRHPGLPPGQCLRFRDSEAACDKGIRLGPRAVTEACSGAARSVSAPYPDDKKKIIRGMWTAVALKAFVSCDSFLTIG